jgi:hypothetical protein
VNAFLRAVADDALLLQIMSQGAPTPSYRWSWVALELVAKDEARVGVICSKLDRNSPRSRCTTDKDATSLRIGELSHARHVQFREHG